MTSIKEKTKYLFLHFISPKEIIFIFFLIFLSFFFFLVFLYKSSTYVMGERVLYSGSMTEGIIGNLKETDPYKAATEADSNLNRLLYSSLIRNVTSTSYELALAERVEISSDKTTYRVILKDKATFSNGEPITIDDVLYSINRVPLEKNYTVERTDDTTLTFKLKKAGTVGKENFLDLLTYPIIPKNEVFENNFTKNLVTSSFFKIYSIQKDMDGNVIRVTLERFNNGENKLPYLKTYSLVYFKNEVDAYNAFQKKEIDLLSGVPGSTITKIQDDKNIEFVVAPLPNNYAVFLNQNTNEVLRDATLRQALSDVVDRESLTNQVLGSFGIPEKDILGNKGTTSPVGEIIDSLDSSFIFENGVLYTSTKKTPDTKSGSSTKEAVKIKITTIHNTELEDTAKFLAQAWKKIGVETTVQTIDIKDLNTVVKDRDFEALLFGFSIKNASDYYSFFSSKERNYPKLNISNYTSKDADRILDVLVDESDPARIIDLTQQLSAQIRKDNPVIILYKPQFVFAHFLGSKIKLPDKIVSENDRYMFVQNWYTDTEKVLSIFNKMQFIDKLDTWLY